MQYFYGFFYVDWQMLQADATNLTPKAGEQKKYWCSSMSKVEEKTLGARIMSWRKW